MAPSSQSPQNTGSAALPPGPTSTAWHTLTPEQAAQALGVSAEGLTTDESRRRQQQYGANRLDAVVPPRMWRRVAAQFHNLLIYVLLAAVVTTALIGHGIDAAVIMAVVLLNVGIGVLQEGKAEKALQAIR